VDGDCSKPDWFVSIDFSEVTQRSDVESRLDMGFNDVSEPTVDIVETDVIVGVEDTEEQGEERRRDSSLPERIK
jgi:hypothetical protein